MILLLIIASTIFCLIINLHGSICNICSFKAKPILIEIWKYL